MDFRSAWRALFRARGFSALVVATVALGIAVATTMFSVVWAVFLRPLPLPEQNRLVTVWEADPRAAEPLRRVTPANFVDWEAQAASFEALGALPNWTGEPWPFNVAGPNGLERAAGVYASSGFFRVARVPPLLGRVFGADEDRTQGRRTVVISHAYWRTRFAGDPSVVGRRLRVDTFRGGDFEIIGVMPAGFDLPRAAQFWLSLGDWGGGPMPPRDSSQRCCSWYTAFGRLKPGVTIAQATAELTAIARRISATHPDVTPTTEVRLVPLRTTIVGNHDTTLFGLLGAVGCVLLIGCANVANLLLSRGVGRRKEVLTRRALGATPWRIARQLITESLMLGCLGAALGLVVSLWAQDVVASSLTGRIPLIEDTRMDWPVFGFAVALTLVTSTLCGVAPLADWRTSEWNSRGQTESRRARAVRHALVIGEVALSVALVGSAGLFIKSVANLRAVDVGFDMSRTLVLATDLSTEPLRPRGRSAQFIGDVLPRLGALPGVRAVGATTGVPLEAGPATQAITRQGDPIRSSALSPQVRQMAVTPGYFPAMGIALSRGRLFTEEDRGDGVLVAILNETAARRYWAGTDPIGRRFAIGSADRFGSFRAVRNGEIEWREIVGVVADMRSAGFASPIQPEVYYNYKQYPLYDPSIVIRTTDDPVRLIAAARREIKAVSDGAVIVRARTLEDIANESVSTPRLRATLASTFSALALLLGMLGIYGVMSYTVAQQRREIGVRVALGAQRWHVVRMITGTALRLTVSGLAAGLIGTYIVARGISSLFFGVSPADAMTLAATSLLVIAAALVASASPTRRALRVEPTVALKEE